MEEFLQRRNISKSVIEEIISQKIDEHVILLMEDNELEKYFPKYGDRIAIKDYCARTCWKCQGSKRKMSLLEKLRLRLSPNHDASDEENKSPNIRKRKYNSEKDVRMVELGWLNKESGKKSLQVRAKKGGGTRKLELPKLYKKPDILKEAIMLFFPNGLNDQGHVDDFVFSVLDFKGNELPDDVTINDILTLILTLVKQLRFYLQSTPKTTSNDKIAESCQISASSIQQYDTMASSALNESLQLCKDKSESPPQNIICESPTENPEMRTNHPVSSTNFLQSLEDDYNLDELLYLHPSIEIHDIEREAEEKLHQVRILTVHRGNIFEEFLKAAEYKFFDNRHIKIEIILPNGELESGEDFGGVYRDALSEFWCTFYELCTVGTNLKVPYLRHDFGETEWQNIAKICVKGFETEKYIPIRLAPVFIQSCFGEEVNDNDILDNFLQYLSDSEGNIVKQSLENFENVDTEELIDFLTLYDSKWNPTKQNIRQLIRDVAHKELIQKPAFVIKCFGNIFKTSTLTLLEIKHLGEQIKPTAKNCLAKIEVQSGQEISADATRVYGYLKKFIKEANETKRSAFFRYCTGSDLPIQNISILFTKTAPGIGRVPIAHTCTCVLELPDTYENYVNFRSEFNGILSSNIWVMDII